MNVEDNNTPSFADVETSHALTADERAELEAAAKESDAAAAATEQSAAAKAAADAEAQAAVDAAKAEQDAAAAEAAKAAEAEAAASAATRPALRDVPAAPKDFDAARADLKQKYEDGDLTTDEYADAREKLADERAEWIAAKTMAEQHNAAVTAALTAEANESFEKAAGAFIKANADFMANPIRAKAMQEAIDAVDAQTGGKLPPAKVIAEASKIAFDAFNWTPKPAVDPTAAKNDAMGKRQPPAPGPTNLGSAPNAGGERGGSSFSDLDAGSVVDMERAIATMSPEEREKFLLEVDPG